MRGVQEEFRVFHAPTADGFAQASKANRDYRAGMVTHITNNSLWLKVHVVCSVQMQLELEDVTTQHHLIPCKHVIALSSQIMI
jgi:hypothetical protein